MDQKAEREENMFFEENLDILKKKNWEPKLALKYFYKKLFGFKFFLALFFS